MPLTVDDPVLQLRFRACGLSTVILIFAARVLAVALSAPAFEESVYES